MSVDIDSLPDDLKSLITRDEKPVAMDAETLSCVTKLTEEVQRLRNTSQLVVTELRPMSEAPRDETTIMLAVHPPEGGKVSFEFGYWDKYEEGWRVSPIDVYGGDWYLGWTPMPQYKPNKPEPFKQPDLPGNCRAVSGVDEVGGIAKNAARETAKMQG